MSSPLILCIETATKTCSVALALGDKVIALKESHGNYSHSENLAPFIDDVLKQTGKVASEINAIAVSKGPGSYTGLRIGVSLAKGLCFGTGAELIGIETLDGMAALAIDEIKEEGIYIPMIDARRMEVYTAVYNHKNEKLAPTRAQVLDEATFIEYLSVGPVYFFGDGAAKFQEIMKHSNARFPEKTFCSAEGLISLAYEKFTKGETDDTASFEPYYLKDFMPGKGSV